MSILLATSFKTDPEARSWQPFLDLNTAGTGGFSAIPSGTESLINSGTPINGAFGGGYNITNDPFPSTGTQPKYAYVALPTEVKANGNRVPTWKSLYISFKCKFNDCSIQTGALGDPQYWGTLDYATAKMANLMMPMFYGYYVQDLIGTGTAGDTSLYLGSGGFIYTQFTAPGEGGSGRLTYVDAPSLAHRHFNIHGGGASSDDPREGLTFGTVWRYEIYMVIGKKDPTDVNQEVSLQHSNSRLHAGGLTYDMSIDKDDIQYDFTPSHQNFPSRVCFGLTSGGWETHNASLAGTDPTSANWGNGVTEQINFDVDDIVVAIDEPKETYWRKGKKYWFLDFIEPTGNFAAESVAGRVYSPEFEKLSFGFRRDRGDDSLSATVAYEESDPTHKRIASGRVMGDVRLMWKPDRWVHNKSSMDDDIPESHIREGDSDDMDDADTILSEEVWRGRLDQVDVREDRKELRIRATGISSILGSLALKSGKTYSYTNQTIAAIVYDIIANATYGFVHATNGPFVAASITGSVNSILYKKLPLMEFDVGDTLKSVLSTLAELAGEGEIRYGCRGRTIFFQALEDDPWHDVSPDWVTSAPLVPKASPSTGSAKEKISARKVVNSVRVIGGKKADGTRVDVTSESPQSVARFGERRKVVRKAAIKSDGVASQLGAAMVGEGNAREEHTSIDMDRDDVRYWVEEENISSGSQIGIRHQLTGEKTEPAARYGGDAVSKCMRRAAVDDWGAVYWDLAPNYCVDKEFVISVVFGIKLSPWNWLPDGESADYPLFGLANTTRVGTTWVDTSGGTGTAGHWWRARITRSGNSLSLYATRYEAANQDDAGGGVQERVWGPILTVNDRTLSELPLQHWTFVKNDVHEGISLGVSGGQVDGMYDSDGDLVNDNDLFAPDGHSLGLGLDCLSGFNRLWIGSPNKLTAYWDFDDKATTPPIELYEVRLYEGVLGLSISSAGTGAVRTEVVGPLGEGTNMYDLIVGADEPMTAADDTFGPKLSERVLERTLGNQLAAWWRAGFGSSTTEDEGLVLILGDGTKLVGTGQNDAPHTIGAATTDYTQSNGAAGDDYVMDHVRGVWGGNSAPRLDKVTISPLGGPDGNKIRMKFGAGEPAVGLTLSELDARLGGLEKELGDD